MFNGDRVSVNGDRNYVHNGDAIILPQPRPTKLQAMIAQLDEESEEAFRGFVEELLQYKESAQGTIIGLEGKLVEAKREDDLQRALQGKERFAKKVFKNQLSPGVQRVYAEILGILCVSFRYKVLPMIRAGEGQVKVDCFLYDEIICKINEEVGYSVLKIGIQDIVDMLYYLTGNCHVRWV